MIGRMKNTGVLGIPSTARDITARVRAGAITAAVMPGAAVRGLPEHKRIVGRFREKKGPIPGEILCGDLVFLDGVVLDLPPAIIAGDLGLLDGVVLDLPPAIIYQEGGLA